MDEKLAYWGSVIFSALALVLIVVNISLSNTNRALQLDVSQRQTSLNAAQAFTQLNQGLIQALAEAAYKNNNTETRELLATQGITLKNGTPGAPAPAAAVPAPAPVATATPSKPAQKK